MLGRGGTLFSRGALPLDLLDEQVAAYIAAAKR
jgi:hypothetical protein